MAKRPVAMTPINAMKEQLRQAYEDLESMRKAGSWQAVVSQRRQLLEIREQYDLMVELSKRQAEEEAPVDELMAEIEEIIPTITPTEAARFYKILKRSFPAIDKDPTIEQEEDESETPSK